MSGFLWWVLPRVRQPTPHRNEPVAQPTGRRTTKYSQGERLKLDLMVATLDASSNPPPRVITQVGFNAMCFLAIPTQGAPWASRRARFSLRVKRWADCLLMRRLSVGRWVAGCGRSR